MYVPATLAPPAPSVSLQALSSQAPGGEVPPPATKLVPTATSLSARHADLNVLAGRIATIAGSLRPRLAGRLVELQLRAHRRWRTVVETHTGARGRYRLRYRTHGIGSQSARVRFAGDAEDRGSHRRVGRLNVYRVVGASWYGGGGSLACGGSLTSATLGVANKTLPCGMLVTLRYDGRTLRVPVIDRGPYVAGREFDLTEATKRTLGFEGVGEVWATG
jgi:peptidoglycan lytic transglycosylase